MIGRPLMTVDELKSMPKGQFIVMKTGSHPMISPLKLYFRWGIKFEEPFIMSDKGSRMVAYMERDKLFSEIKKKYPQNKNEAAHEVFDFPDTKPKLKTKKVGDKNDNTRENIQAETDGN